jgi:hypothetical protein
MPNRAPMPGRRADADAETPSARNRFPRYNKRKNELPAGDGGRRTNPGESMAHRLREVTDSYRLGEPLSRHSGGSVMRGGREDGG